MTQFCETCPLKGECDQEISAVYVKDVYYRDVFGRNALAGRFAVAVDQNSAPSDPISYSPRFSSDVIAKELPHRIDMCEQPRTIGFAFFKRKLCAAFNEEVMDYESTPAGLVETKEHFIARVLQKHANILGHE